MPIRHTDKGWFWGSKGPFPTKQKAMQVGQAAYASGYKEEEMEDNQEYSVQKCVIYLLHAVTNAHILHLQTKSYAEHKALKTLYSEIGDLVDGFVEAYQGKYGIIENYPEDYKLPQPPIQYVVGLSTYLQEARPYLPQDTELQNILDEIASLLDSTLYKLRFLS
jgi:hypothetical protein